MQLGMIGLGRMGANMVRRLIQGGHECVVFDRNHESVTQLTGEGGIGAGKALDASREACLARDVSNLVRLTRRKVAREFPRPLKGNSCPILSPDGAVPFMPRTRVVAVS